MHAGMVLTSWPAIASQALVRPSKVDLQFIATARITPNTGSSVWSDAGGDDKLQINFAWHYRDTKIIGYIKGMRLQLYT